MAIATNKKAYHDYEILETFIAGLVLSGPEVKSVKNGRVDLKGSFASVERGELWLKNTYIAPYSKASRQQVSFDPYQSRKLLINKKEISYLVGKTEQKGTTLVPLNVFNSHGLIKLELGLVRGKRKADKRESIKKRDFERKKQQLYRQNQ